MEIESSLNTFAIRSFRDIADYDYIAARMAYRASLFPQFHWSALQALEKYIKAILLINRIEAKDIRHDIGLALRYCEKLPFKISLSKISHEFIDHIDTYGRYRYLEASYRIDGPKLVELDRAIWELRRYCKVLNYVLKTSNEEQPINMLDQELGIIERSNNISPQKFKLISGKLEAIIQKKDHPARAPLIWKNMFFGSMQRNKVKMYTPMQATNSPLAMYPELLDVAAKYVLIPKEIIKAYKNS
jgi:HEPN domain-containing protein